MPPDRRKRTTRHPQLRSDGASAEEKDSSREVVTDQHLEIDGVSSLKKKERKQIKHQALLQRLGGTASSPYSKSHMRRLRRKQKETLSADLTTVKQAIAAIETETPGGGKGLSQHQRKRALEAENLRYKLVIQDKNFLANPFHAIRTHAQNTLVKRQPQA